MGRLRPTPSPLLPLLQKTERDTANRHTGEGPGSPRHCMEDSPSTDEVGSRVGAEWAPLRQRSGLFNSHSSRIWLNAVTIGIYSVMLLSSGEQTDLSIGNGGRAGNGKSTWNGLFFLKSAVLLKTNGLAFRTWTNISYVDSLLKSTHGAWLRSWLSGLWKRSPRRPRGKGFLLRVTWQFYCHPAQMTLNQHRWTSCQGVLLPPVRGYRRTPSFSRPSPNYWPFVSSKSATRVHTTKLH